MIRRWGLMSWRWRMPSVQWLPPSACLPPHGVTHPDKLLQLYREFSASGWDLTKPVLVGYPYGEGIQLLNGSHRWAAAVEAGIEIPVKIVPYGDVWACWGHLERWMALVRGYERGVSDGMGGE